jgi:hypothetical protein
MADDDLKTLVREFRTSVAADLEAQHQRIDRLADELRDRFGTAETAILNEVRDLGGRLDRRLGRVESRVGDVESRLGGVESRLGGVESRLGNIEDPR